MFSKLLPLLLFLQFFSGYDITVSAEFIPTHEWQIIPPDTAVPPGLHYRMDLSTGVKMAKLLEPDDSETSSAVMIPVKLSSPSSDSLPDSATSFSVESDSPSLDDSSLSSESFESRSSDPSSSAASQVHSSISEDSSSEPPALSPFRQKEKILLGTGLFDDVLKEESMSEEAYTSLVEKLWKQRQDEIRAVYEMMEHADKVIDPFIHALSEARPDTNSKELLQKLEKLEELISTADMGLVFVQRGGWPPLVSLLHSRYSTDVRASAAFVVGSALRQSDENKVWALEPRGPGAVPLGSALYQLMEILDSRSDPSHHEEALLSKAVYAISAAANTNQEVQTHLLGPFLTSLGRILSEDWSTALRIKVMQFGTDMMVSAKEDTTNSEHYARLRMSLSGWCGGIQTLTSQVVADPSKLEKTIEAAVQLVREACPSSFHEFASIFKEAQHLYANGNVNMGEAYRTELLQVLTVVSGLD